MDDLFALFTGDNDGGEVSPSAYDDQKNTEIEGAGGADEEEEEEEEHDEEEDMDIEFRPVKRSRSTVCSGPCECVRRIGAAAGSGPVDELYEGEKEVIEILSDDEDAKPPAQSQALFRDDFSNQLATNRQLDHASSARHLFDDDFSNSLGAGSQAAAGARAAAAARSSEQASADGYPRDALKSSHPSAEPGMKIGHEMVSSSARSNESPGVAGDGCVVPPSAAEGKPSPEEKAAAVKGAGWWSGGVATASTAVANNDNVGLGGQTGSTSTSRTAVTAELPRNLECAMCFNPLAVVALFACGHGSCWECAHDWCSRESTSTMDCPTCHVSIPRNDFRRCVLLDQVVDRAVVAAGMDDDEWRSRLERGQKLAREAETRRRSSRDAQRRAEDTIAEQAAELEKLREEARDAKSRRVAGRRTWRSYESSPQSMAGYGFRLLSGSGGGSGRDFLDSASQRSAVEEVARLRHRRGETADGGPMYSSRDPRGAAGDGSDVAAAAFGMPPTYGVVRSRGQTHPLSTAAAAASTGFGPSEGDPWFALRPSQPSRQTVVSASGGRVVRDASGGSNAFGRSAGNSAAAMEFGPPSGSALKSAHEQTSGGSSWRSSAYLNAGRLSLSGGGGGGGGGGGARTRRYITNTNTDPRGNLISTRPAGVGAALDRGPLGPGPSRDLVSQTFLARSSRKTNCFSGLSYGGASASGAAAVASASSRSLNHLGGGLSPPPSSSPSLQYDISVGMIQPSRSADGEIARGGLQFVSRNSGRPGQVPSPMLDLDEFISGQEESGSRSEWDDVLAAVSTPPQGVDEGLGRSSSPGAMRG